MAESRKSFVRKERKKPTTGSDDWISRNASLSSRSRNDTSKARKIGKTTITVAKATVERIIYRPKLAVGDKNKNEIRSSVHGKRRDR